MTHETRIVARSVRALSQRTSPWLVVWLVLGVAAVGRGDESPAPSDWQPQGEWLVNARHRCELRKPAADGWTVETDSIIGPAIIHRTPAATVYVAGEVRSDERPLRQIVQDALAAALDQRRETHFLTQARFRQRTTTFQRAHAISLLIEGPHTDSPWRTDRYLFFKRRELLVILRASATPRGAYEEHRQAISDIFNGLTWF